MVVKLSDIFAQLTSGEMIRHSIGDDLVDGAINPEHYVLVLPMVNLAILTLFTRFNAKQEQVIIRLSDTITRYKLHSDHSLLNTTSTKPKYIHDSVDYPFVDDTLIKILSIHNEIGEEHFLNVENNHWSLHTPSYNVVQHPYPDRENAISVVYQASIPTIQLTTGFDPKQIEVDIPPMFLEPVLYFIGARVHIGLNDQETFNESNNFTQKYEKAIANIRQGQLVQTEFNVNTKLEQRGWI